MIENARLSLLVVIGFAGCAVGRTNMRMSVDEKGSGEPLVLVGGGLTGWLSWERHQAALAATRRVARFQPINVQVGLEGRPLPAGYSVAFESQALAAALDDLGLRQPVDLVAWSYGALVHPELRPGSRCPVGRGRPVPGAPGDLPATVNAVERADSAGRHWCRASG